MSRSFLQHEPGNSRGESMESPPVPDRCFRCLSQSHIRTASLTSERVRLLAHTAFAFTTTYQVTMQTSAAKTCKTLAAAACIATGVGLACHWYRAKTQGRFAVHEHLSTSLRSVPPFSDVYVGPIHLCVTVSCKDVTSAQAVYCNTIVCFPTGINFVAAGTH